MIWFSSLFIGNRQSAIGNKSENLPRYSFTIADSRFTMPIADCRPDCRSRRKVQVAHTFCAGAVIIHIKILSECNGCFTV